MPGFSTLKVLFTAAAMIAAAPPAEAGSGLIERLFNPGSAHKADLKEDRLRPSSNERAESVLPDSVASVPTARPATLPTVMPMATAGPTEIPIGHFLYCLRYQEDCLPHEPLLVRLNNATMDLLVQINDEVNAEIQPRSDEEQYGQDEWWEYPTSGYGDCEDYVLEKRRRLVEAGWPASALLITVVAVIFEDGSAAGHSVLTAITDQGDLVLDSLNSRVLPWQDVPYEFMSRQTAANAVKWEAIDDFRLRERQPVVAAVP